MGARERGKWPPGGPGGLAGTYADPMSPPKNVHASPVPPPMAAAQVSSRRIVAAMQARSVPAWRNTAWAQSVKDGPIQKKSIQVLLSTASTVNCTQPTCTARMRPGDKDSAERSMARISRIKAPVEAKGGWGHAITRYVTAKCRSWGVKHVHASGRRSRTQLAEGSAQERSRAHTAATKPSHQHIRVQPLLPGHLAPRRVLARHASQVTPAGTTLRCEALFRVRCVL